MKRLLASQGKYPATLVLIGMLVAFVAPELFAQGGADEGDSILASLVILFVLLPLSLGFLSAYYFLGKSAYQFLGKVNFYIAGIIVFIYFKWLGGPSSGKSTLLLILPFIQLLLFFMTYPKELSFELGKFKPKHKTVGFLFMIFYLTLGNYVYRDFYLYHSCRLGLVTPAKLLIHLGANARIPGFLYTAAYHGNTQVANLMIAAGANTDQLHGIDLKLYKFLADIRKLDWKPAKQYLDEGGSVNSQNHNGETALLALAGIKTPEKLEVEISRKLLAMGADPNLFDRHKDSPLIRAVELGHAELVSLLLEFKANMNHRGSGFGNLTAFERVVQKNRGRPEDPLIFKAFLEAGVDIHGRDQKGYTFLMQAVLAKNLEFSKILIEKGVSLNAVEPTYGLSALFLVVGNLGSRHPSDVPILKLLLRSGVNAQLADKKGKHARDVFKALKRNDLLAVLDSHNG
ncbi:MAG: hypothetical protein HRU09_07800 [Oligoflexales bacterium]|nr:hypothetical protein [Oligoflexales bacterium]